MLTPIGVVVEYPTETETPAWLPHLNIRDRSYAAFFWYGEDGDLTAGVHGYHRVHVSKEHYSPYAAIFSGYNAPL